ncbi:MAG: 3-hydroxyacyl-CoA dehydrogenase NAD-binding domain-containing protein [Parachlamydiales bacterium]|jgi:3-hydroxyacyl-CoA dehydrogenase/enoyl-CoA hydratase/3-hydroxybutyryl-CoA epimerase
MTSAFQLQNNADGIALLTFNLPNEKVNKFNLAILAELDELIDTIAKDSSIKALKIVSGKDDVFIAGADLHSFEPAFDDPSIAEKIINTGHRVFNKLSSLPFPTIAVIHGACLGGGLEFVLSCTYRIVSDHPKTLLALPEVNLGIFPGWGGTQRLPRLVGLTEGLNMILTGKMVPAVKAYKAHLADAIFAWQFLQPKADEFIKQILTSEGKKKVLDRRQQLSFVNKLMQNNPLGRSFVFYQSKKAVLEKTHGHYPAPLIALDVIKNTYTLPLNEGLKKEADTFIAKIPEGFANAPDLISLFFTQEAAKKETGAPENIKGKEITSSAVIGAGTMGAGIAWLLADHNIFVRLKDVSWDLVGKGIGFARGYFNKGVKAKKITCYDLDRRFQLISGSIDYSGFDHAEIIIEAATENLELKKKIFQEVEANVKPDAIIASNTSSLTIEEMSEGMQHPERFVGMHFFNPVNKMPLVEVVAGKHSSPQAIASTVSLCRKLGKTPLVVGDCHGFLVNRIFMQGANEVMLMLEEGYSWDELKNQVLNYGMPMDPFELADEVGNDVSYKVGKTFEKAYGERMRPAKILQLMTEKQLYGKKNGKGFYIYQGSKKTQNPEINDLIKQVGRKQPNNYNEDIIPRFIYGMVNEASRCLEEGIISRPDFLDLGLIMGIGFPPFRGGLLRYADKVTPQNIVATLRRLETQQGSRFKPSNLLVKKAESNTLFYPPLPS